MSKESLLFEEDGLAAQAADLLVSSRHAVSALLVPTQRASVTKALVAAEAGEWSFLAVHSLMLSVVSCEKKQKQKKQASMEIGETEFYFSGISVSDPHTL